MPSRRDTPAVSHGDATAPGGDGGTSDGGARSAGPVAAAGTLRARLTWVLTVMLGLVGALGTGAIVWVQAAALEHQLDASLRTHAASEVLTAIDRPDRAAHLHDAPLPVPGAPAALEKFAALYDERGAALAQTASFGGAAGVPRFSALPRAGGPAFDLAVRGRVLRAVLVPMGHETSARALLLAVPRRELDAAIGRLALVAAAVFGAVLLAAFGVAAAVAAWLTRDLHAIAATARAVAAGDLAARVGAVGGAREVRALARDLDEMIARLATLVASQRRFVSDAAHELRAPLTSLRGELELAMRRARSAEEYRATLARVHGDVLALAALTDELLALARARTRPADAGRDAHADVGAAVARAVALVAPRASERGVRVAVRPRGRAGGPALRAAIGAGALERVVRNLVENAARFAPSGTEVEVTIAADDDDDDDDADAARDAALGARRDDGAGHRAPASRVTIAVQDRGPGVPLEQAERVFEPFVRLDPARAREGGAGLGLAIARETARTYGGDVALDVDAPGPGARFVIWLPRAPPRAG